MSPLKISAVGIAAMALLACASNGASTRPSDATSVTTTTSGTPAGEPARAPSPMEPRDSNATMLTSANVSSLVSAPPSHDASREEAARWTDAEIVAAVAAAQETEDELRLVREKSKSARVDRLATQMLMDQRELTSGQASLARKIPAQQSDMSSRAADARRQVTDAVGAPGSGTYDRHFLDAEMAYCRTMLQLLDTEMIPSARSSDLKQYLQNFRSKTASRLLQAQEIDGQIR